MSLSSELITQFVKATNDKAPSTKKTIGYGTIVKQDDAWYVHLDGSTQVTPVISTASVKAGDRVTVEIKNHTAIVTGNLSDPSASAADVKEMGTAIAEFDIIIADKVSTEVLDAERARINDLVADNVTIKEQLTATSASIDILEADSITVNQKLTAAEAEIGTLKTDKIDTLVANATYATIENLEATNVDIYNLEASYGEFAELTTGRFAAIEADINDLDAKKLSATEAELTYANVDFSNITKAAMEYFYANSGLIEDVTIGDATITGRLVGVTISGNLIEADTIVAEKLVIQGEDGLYHKLNTDGESISTEQTEYNSLNGKVLLAKSVTAEHIAVDDLVAFAATIGGFHIADHAIYSGVKESVDNTTTGLYLDDEGQMALGDSENYLKYHKNEDGSYTLDISAVKKVNDELRETVAEESTSILQNAEGIFLNALKDYVSQEDYAELSDRINSELQILSDKISVSVTDVNKNVDDRANELQEQLNTITKYFTFDVNGLTIGQNGSLYKIVIDNDRYSMFVGEEEVLWMDSTTREVYAPTLTTTKKFNMLGYSVQEDHNGNINWQYVGGE